MGSDQSTLPAGAPGSNLRSQRDEEIPYTQYSISKPIDSGELDQPTCTDSQSFPVQTLINYHII